MGVGVETAGGEDTQMGGLAPWGCGVESVGGEATQMGGLALNSGKVWFETWNILSFVI